MTLLPSLWLALGSPPAAAEVPLRQPAPKPARLAWTAGREREVLVVKVAEGSPRIPRVAGARTQPLFSRSSEVLRAERRAWDPEHRLADLTAWWRLQVPASSAETVANQLNQQPWVEVVYFAFAPAPPPVDLDPETPDLTAGQSYAGAAPDGFGFQEVAAWPGGRGENVVVADLEYSWRRDHEDLDAAVDATTWGHDGDYYPSHGTAVLGMLVGGDNGYGITGLVPEATPVVIHPHRPDGVYSVADAVDGAAGLLEPGDVLLIEQQVYDAEIEAYLPVEWDPATFDAISLAVAKGIVVVEPGANGAQNLDHAKFGGWFDREQRDSGAILVGGGASPLSGLPPRSWSAWGSSYGSRVDVQGWYDSVVTTWNDEGGTWNADLFLPETEAYPSGDPRQGYTSRFAGTSAASPLVAAVCAVTNSVAIELHGQPFDPLDLRALLVSTGTPQPPEDAHIGPQPDLRAALRYGLLP